MAAVKEAVLTNGYGDIKINGHSSEEEISTKEIQAKGGVKNVPLYEEKPTPVPTPKIKSTPKPADEEVRIYEDGPEQVIPTENVWTAEASGRVKLRVDANNEVANQPPISVPGLMSRAVAQWPDHTALSYKLDGEWKNVTFREYEQNVRTVAKAFLALGLQKYHGVCIIGFNSPEWFYADLGAIYAGGFAVGMYTTNNPDACHHCLDQSNANICVVEDDKQLQKILKIKDSLPHLKVIVQYTGTPTAPGVMSWAELMDLGKKQDETELEAALKKIAINECCTLVFTSGTEGKSKAVMLSHDSLTWDAFAAKRYLEVEDGTESIVSYLPLSHIAAQLADIYITMTVGAKTAFADRDALKGSLVKTLGEVRPTVFLAVPRVWEKIHEKMMAIGAQTTGLKKMIATWGKACCLQHNMDLMNGNTVESYRYKFYRWLVFSRIKAALGLDRARICLSAAAPISTDIKQYFMSIDILVADAFGMSECSGAHTLSKATDFQIDSIGRTVPGAETKLHNPDADGQGEICMRGRHVLMGYLGEPEKTKAAIDSDGWLHSGDVGTIDDKGFVRITGRIKELLITAGGENIPPVLIEQTIKKELPCISNAQLIGDRRKFLSVLLTLKTEMDADSGAPKDELTQEVKNWCKELGCEVNTVTEVLEGPKKEIMDAIQAGIDRANTQAVSNAQRVQKFAILPADFSVPTGELGPTLKLKRNVVYDKYSDIIENFYKDC